VGKLGEQISHFFALRFQAKWWFLALSWTLAAGLCLVDLTNDDHFSRAGSRGEFVPQSLGRNEIEGFHFVHYDPDEQESNFSISFKRLRSQNAPLGTFRTALFKVVNIEDLELCYHQNTSLSDSSNDTAAISGLGDLFFPGINYSGDDYAERSNYLQDYLCSRGGRGEDDYVELILPDMSNAAETNVKGFKYELFRKGRASLAVQSKRAFVSYRNPQIIALRGHVIISLNETTLESNRVTWDVLEQKFTVEGKYLLTHNQRKTSGDKICLDANLQPVNKSYPVKNMIKNREI